MPEYQGHKNWNHWNVALWIMNDERVYRYANYLIKRHNRDVAARKLMIYCKAHWANLGKTPDDAPLNITNVRAAITNWHK